MPDENAAVNPEENSSNDRSTSITVSIRWGDDSQLQTIFANQLFISSDGPQTYLIFGELTPSIPLILNKETVREAVIRPVVRLTVPQGAMAEMIRLLNKHFRPVEKPMVEEGENAE